MLFIQKITVYYDGKGRFPERARERERLKFFPIDPKPKKFGKAEPEYSKMLDCEVLFQDITCVQNENNIIVREEIFKRFGNEIFTEGKRGQWATFILENIRLFKEDEKYRIMFCDDSYFGNFSRSKRHGHNEAYNKKGSPFRYTDRLNETAFSLKDGEYGRIYFNNRYVHPHTRNQVYKYVVYNIVSCERSHFREKMFFRKNPDHEYKNLKSLY